MNETMKVLVNRKTHRDFDEQYVIPEEALNSILKAARQAPSWMNGQFYSIFVIRDEQIRKQLVEWNPGNPHMLKSSVFLIFAGDLYRTQCVSEEYGVENLTSESIDSTLIAATDAALALGSAVTAVESMGLGSVVVGSIRKHGKEISELLEMPVGMFPLFGLSIGKPTVEMKVKPRLPKETIIFHEKFTSYPYTLIEEYDETMEKFGEVRETKLWSKKFADYFSSKPNRLIDQLLKLKRVFK
ncbi:nitroreductase family protein [Enterococcus sp. CWB-B31]|uniref:nitroreductase family protein n=1 Tax=Enterococcus sp. CWB-B31 TaxID=2885159 RepID=UPI001E573726|nr:nitroreductase family protein [Enterococcus sp. CWB-B31]MCB5954371.1 nitroreductase family protein [Enterococcus sp. CWB-B31]